MSEILVPKVFTSEQIKAVVDAIISESIDGTFPKMDKLNGEARSPMSMMMFGMSAMIALHEVMKRLGCTSAALKADPAMYEASLKAE